MKRKQIRDNALYESRFGFKERTSNFLFDLALLCVLAVFLFGRFWFVNTFSGVEVSGSSMRNTLQDGDKLFMRRVDKTHTAERGDVIIIDVTGYSECKGVAGGHLVKRLVALEGEWVRCTDGVVEISKDDRQTWEVLDEPYAYYGVNDSHKANYDFSEYRVDEGEVFFLGDNRSGYGSSIDSRYLDVYGNNIKGSHLDDLYKKTDIVGVIPDWAIEYKSVLSALFFPDSDIKA